MPFKKGNQLWKKGQAAIKENKQRVNELMSIIVSGGFSEYADKLDSLAKKETLTKEELEFMDRLEKLFPYAVSKLSSIELTGKDGGPVEVNVTKAEEIGKALEDL